MTPEVQVKTQRPADREIYEMDFDRLYFKAQGDSAAALVELISTPGVTVSSNPPVGSMTSGVLKIAVSGVVAGQTYQVIARVESNAGRRREWEFRVLGIPGGLDP